VWVDLNENVSKMLHVVAFAPDRVGAEIGKSQAKAGALFAFYELEGGAEGMEAGERHECFASMN
jgi:hypothetical protein